MTDLLLFCLLMFTIGLLLRANKTVKDGIYAFHVYAAIQHPVAYTLLLVLIGAVIQIVYRYCYP